jgi:hypothetical protein
MFLLDTIRNQTDDFMVFKAVSTFDAFEEIIKKKMFALCCSLTQSGFKPMILWSSRQYQHLMHMRRLLYDKQQYFKCALFSKPS